MKGPPFIKRSVVEEEVTDESLIPSIRQALIFLRWNGGILLICNKKNEMITGIGGSLDPGETPYDAAARCVYDYGMRCRKMKLLGLIELELNQGRKKFHVHILSSNVFSGRLRETEDGLPIWVRCADIPYGRMPEDYCLWLPLLLQGLAFKGAFRNRNKRVIEKYKLGVVYRGPERYCHKTFGHPLNPERRDKLAKAAVVACDEGNRDDFNIVDQLDSDAKIPLFRRDVFGEMKARLDQEPEEDCAEIVD